MYEALIGRINNDLKDYEETIDEIDANFGILETFGRYQARAPLRYKYKIHFSIEYLENKGVELSELENQFNILNKKLIFFKQKRGKTYLDKVFEELKYLVEDYSTTVCFFLELDPIDIETDDDLNKRDIIEILLTELQSDYDVHDIKVKVSALDEALKCKFKINMDTILKECTDIEKPYYPENFWWRHPSKLID